MLSSLKLIGNWENSVLGIIPLGPLSSPNMTWPVNLQGSSLLITVPTTSPWTLVTDFSFQGNNSMNLLSLSVWQNLRKLPLSTYSCLLMPLCLWYFYTCYVSMSMILLYYVYDLFNSNLRLWLKSDISLNEEQCMVHISCVTFYIIVNYNAEINITQHSYIWGNIYCELLDLSGHFY